MKHVNVKSKFTSHSAHITEKLIPLDVKQETKAKKKKLTTEMIPKVYN